MGRVSRARDGKAVVGATDGAVDGLTVGACVIVGLFVGRFLGALVGYSVGPRVGCLEGRYRGPSCVLAATTSVYVADNPTPHMLTPYGKW